MVVFAGGAEEGAALTSMVEIYREYKKAKYVPPGEVAKRDIEEQYDQELFEKHEIQEALPTKRHRKYSWLAPIHVSPVCRLCTAMCCRLKSIHVALTYIERRKIIEGKLPWKVELSVPYPNANKKWRSLQLIKTKLDDVPDDAYCCERKATDEEIAEMSKASMKRLEDERRLNRQRFARCGGIKGHPQEHQSNYHQVVWYLAKKPNGECLYLNSRTGRCGIYHQRSHACKAWFCGTGDPKDWQRTFDKLCEYAREEGRETMIPSEQKHRGVDVFVQRREHADEEEGPTRTLDSARSWEPNENHEEAPADTRDLDTSCHGPALLGAK